MRLRFSTLLLLALFPVSALHAQNFAPESFAGGVSVAGLTNEEATRRLSRELAPTLSRKIALAAGPNQVFRRRADLGFSLDIPKMLAQTRQNRRAALAFRVDRIAAKNALLRLQNPLSTDPINARPLVSGQNVRISPSKNGSRLNVSTSAARLHILGEKNAYARRFVLAAQTAKPRVSSQDLAGIDSVLGTFRTRFNPGEIGRTHNVRLATKSIDGTILRNGATFSLNGTVGERTKSRGYREAIIFESGRKIRGLGGGVSQVTGTLFNAALVAGLPIVSYRTHSQPVKYLPIGRDATVAWGSFDMRFKNDTGAPIYIDYKASRSRLTARIFGKKTGRTTRIRVTRRNNGPRDISANLYRVIFKDGAVQKREKVGSSRYNWKPASADEL